MSVSLDLDLDYGITSIYSDSNISPNNSSQSNAVLPERIFSQYSQMKFSKEAVALTKQSSFGQKANGVFMSRVGTIEGSFETGVTWTWGGDKETTVSAYAELEFGDDKGSTIGGKYEYHEDGSQSASTYGKFTTEFGDD